jgi:hypothetical protein
MAAKGLLSFGNSFSKYGKTLSAQSAAQMARVLWSRSFISFTRSGCTPETNEWVRFFMLFDPEAEDGAWKVGKESWNSSSK